MLKTKYPQKYYIIHSLSIEYAKEGRIDKAIIEVEQWLKTYPQNSDAPKASELLEMLKDYSKKR